MTRPISRRGLFRMAAASATALPGVHWFFEVRDGRIVVAAAQDDVEWKPVLFSRKEADLCAAVCEAIIPRTDTPGARDARVHEYIDLALSLEPVENQKRFREGLEWLNKRCKSLHHMDLREVTAEQVAGLLEPISDLHENHSAELGIGAAFFRDIKSRTIFGYYTSREGLEDLGRPTAVGMETFRGCPHPDGHQ